MEGTDAQEPTKIVALPPVFGLKEVSLLVDEFQAHVEDDALSVDAANVIQMSTPAVLLFVSALKTCAEHDTPIIVHNAPSAFADAFTDLGLFPEVMKMEFRQ